MKSLLVVAPRYPYPTIGGDRLRLYQICKGLSLHFRLTLLSLCETRSEMNASLPDDGVFDHIERVYLPRWRSLLNTALALPCTNTPLQVAYYRSAVLRQHLERLAPKHDAVLAHLIRTGDAVRDLPVTRFLEMTDAISLNYARVTEERGRTRCLRSFIYRIEATRLARYEREIVDDFDHSFLVSSIDREYLFGNNPERENRVTVASNGVDTDMLPYGFSPAAGDLAFIGDMKTLPNQDAVIYMAKHILPLVREQFPGINLRVIGRISPADQARLESLEGVIVTGRVDSVAQAAKGCAVGVCPMRLGAGVQNKILEYMALGLPTVTTPMGVEGLQARNDQELIIADSADKLAEAIQALLKNRGKAQVLAEAARAYVEQRHSWSTQLAPFIEKVLTNVQLARDSR